MIVPPHGVIPAKAGIHFPVSTAVALWIPAFAGMTKEESSALPARIHQQDKYLA
jgi:hypothetical protein